MPSFDYFKLARALFEFLKPYIIPIFQDLGARIKKLFKRNRTPRVDSNDLFFAPGTPAISMNSIDNIR